MDVEVFAHVEGPLLPNPTTIDEMITNLKKFPTTVDAIPNNGGFVKLIANLISYDAVMPSSQNLFDIENRSDVINTAFGYRARAVSDRTSIDYILSHSNLYPSVNVGQLHQDMATINTFLDSLTNRIRDCYNNFSSCNFTGLDYPAISPIPQTAPPPQVSPIQALYSRARLLGSPTSQEQVCGDGKGKCQFFEKGVIFWHPSIGAFFVYAGIYAKYAALHLERGPLGYPISHEEPHGNSGERRSRFQHGSITWNRDHGSTVTINPGT